MDNPTTAMLANGTSSLSPSAFVAKEFASTWQWRIDIDPELAASIGLLSQRRSKHALDPRSLESFEERLDWIEKALQRIKSGITPKQVRNDLTKEEKLSYELYVAQLTDYITYTPKYKAYLCCVNRLEGPQTDLSYYASNLPVQTSSDRMFYRDFLKAIPKQLKEVMELLTRGVAEKRTPPQVSLGGVVEQVRGMVDSGFPSFLNPIKNYFKLPEEQELKEECEALISGAVSEAFRKFANYLENEYIPNIRTEISASKGYPDGESYYQDCLKFHTTTSMTPEEIHQLGLDEIKRVRGEMEAIAADEGYEGRLEAYLEHLRTSTEFEPTSASWLLSHYRDIIERIYLKLLKLIHLNTLPHQPLEVKQTPEAGAGMAPAAYYKAGSTNPNNPTPGTFYVNTYALKSRRTYGCEALTLHEGIPGHHLQGAIQGESINLPDYRKFQEDRRYFEAPCRFPFYTAYIEGWALHCETLGKEIGIYEHKTDEMGQLSMEAMRCCRLVVDTGMHALGWSRDQALAFMLKNTAMGEHDASAEVTRYITWPGQATAYKVGERFIRKMRTMAETDLKDHFDPRDFYDVVLLAAPVPLTVLEELVKEYIDGKMSSSQGVRSVMGALESCSASDTTTSTVQSSTYQERSTAAYCCRWCCGFCTTIYRFISNTTRFPFRLSKSKPHKIVN